jgi:hypothetical protein
VCRRDAGRERLYPAYDSFSVGLISAAPSGKTVINAPVDRRGGVAADLCNIHGVKQIVATAVIAVHIDLAFFRQNAVNFFVRQRFQCACAAFA